ncbi:hypothetical protein SAMN05421788_10442 [Filimonas lacunae]|uniref:Beta-lactamase-inhibitor-like, PepSY-like n=1 Tax=Filimonas lacunae TaxID=477680 RepID=A0A173M9N2_9BACT|nr:hypothetical protein [Filimonas lacunae]BAV04229.1 hypothetical protein FLA_0208 [Filimonas lacunae]SIT13883.1 hypothetical protein SAMN05421788_10442 [Filimonas lacunae]
MKKLIIAALLSITVATSTFATVINNESNIMALFTTAYPTATQVHYKTVGELISVTFILDKHSMQAFYNAEGDKVAESKVISITDLSKAAQENIYRSHPNSIVTEVVEMNAAQEGASGYYVSLVNETHKVILKVSASGEVSVFKKNKK